ncbi:MAG: hypothetical protein U0798_12505 [Gemmataceae bacterium]
MLKSLLSCGIVFAALSIGLRAGDPPVKANPVHPQFEKLKKLVGTWVEVGKDGKPTDRVVSVYRMTAGGSAIHETQMPGTNEEMISVYHLNGADLEMTHYCMLGNQPKMKADPKSPANQIHFQFAGGSNLNPAKDMHMHEATMTFVDDDHIEICGVAWADGKPCENACCQMKLARKK